MSDTTFSVDPAKIDARVAAHEAEATIHERVAEELITLADEKRREAQRLRNQNAALLATARQHGYPEAEDARCGDLTPSPRGPLRCILPAGHEVDPLSLHQIDLDRGPELKGSQP
jgi:hypothetical protein